MKKITATIVTCFFFVSVGFSQGILGAETALANGELGKAKTAIDEVIKKEIEKVVAKNEKLKAKGKDTEPEEASAKSLYTKATIYQAIALSDNPEYRALDENAAQVALDAYKKIMETEKETSPIRVQTGFKLEEFYGGIINYGGGRYEADDMAGAVDAFYFASFINEQDTIGLRNAFLIAAQEDMTDKVELAGKAIMEKGTGDRDFFIIYANEFRKKDDYEGLLKVAQAGVKLLPQESDMGKLMVEAYSRLERIDEAIELLEKQAENNPNDYVVFANLGIMYDNKGNTEKAQENYIKALKINPEDYGLNFNVGAVYYNKAAEVSKVRNNLPANNRGEFLDQDEAKRLKDQMQDYYKQAEPYFIKALSTQKEGSDEALNLLSMLSQMYGIMELPDKKKEIDAKLKQYDDE